MSSFIDLTFSVSTVDIHHNALYPLPWSALTMIHFILYQYVRRGWNPYIIVQQNMWTTYCILDKSMFLTAHIDCALYVRAMSECCKYILTILICIALRQTLPLLSACGDFS